MPLKSTTALAAFKSRAIIFMAHTGNSETTDSRVISRSDETGKTYCTDSPICAFNHDRRVRFLTKTLRLLILECYKEPMKPVKHMLPIPQFVPLTAIEEFAS